MTGYEWSQAREMANALGYERAIELGSFAEDFGRLPAATAAFLVFRINAIQARAAELDEDRDRWKSTASDHQADCATLVDKNLALQNHVVEVEAERDQMVDIAERWQAEVARLTGVNLQYKSESRRLRDALAECETAASPFHRNSSNDGCPVLCGVCRDRRLVRDEIRAIRKRAGVAG